MKHPSKCWKCVGDHYRRDCPTREHQEGSNHKVCRLVDELKAKNQKEKVMEAKGLGPESSK